MYLSTLESLDRGLAVVAFGIPGIAVPGILLFCPLRAVLRRFVPLMALYYNPRYMAPCGPVAGVISFVVPEPFCKTGLLWLLWPRFAALQILRL